MTVSKIFHSRTERDTGGREVKSRFFLKVTFLFIYFFSPFVILYLCSTNIINTIVVAASLFFES